MDDGTYDLSSLDGTILFPYKGCVRIGHLGGSKGGIRMPGILHKDVWRPRAHLAPCAYHHHHLSCLNGHDHLLGLQRIFGNLFGGYLCHQDL